MITFQESLDDGIDVNVGGVSHGNMTELRS